MRRLGIAALSAAMLLVMSAGATFAAKPTITVIDMSLFDGQAGADWSKPVSEGGCGFDVQVEFVGHIIVHEFTGKRLVEIDNWQVSMTYSANGKSVGPLHTAGPDKFWIAPDGTPYEASAGRSIPHDGDGFIGRTVWNLDTGELVSSHGRTFDNPLDQLCATLAP